MIGDLALKPEIRRHLEEPDFKNNLDGALRAVGQLDSAIRVGGGLQDGLEHMQAVKDQRANNDKLKKEFSGKAAKYVEQCFVEAMTEARSNRSVNNNTVYSSLKRIQPLAKYLERLEPELFMALRPKYTALLTPVFKDKMKAYFPLLKDSVFHESRDVRINSFPEYVLEKKAGVRQEIKVVKPVAPAGKKLVTTAFVEALTLFASVIQSEQEFMLSFFGVRDGKEKAAADAAAAKHKSVLSVGGGDTPHHRSTPSSSQLFMSGSYPGLPASTASLAAAGSGGAGASLTVAGSNKAGDTKQDEKKSTKEHADPLVLQNRNDIRKLLEVSFRGLDEHLIDLAETGGKMDHFYSLEMLVAAEKVIADYPLIEYYVGVLTNVSSTCLLRFNKFIDEELKWVETYRTTAKQSGVLVPFAKFPSFVERLDSVVKGARCQAADTSLFKLWNALDKCVHAVAESNDKYMHVVFTENYHFFYRVFVSRAVPVPALAKAMALCDQKYHRMLLSSLLFCLLLVFMCCSVPAVFI